MAHPVNDHALDVIFRDARSYNGWREEDVPEVLITVWLNVPKVHNNSLMELSSSHGSDPGRHRKLIGCSYQCANGLDCGV